ncbi:MAG: PASTA domain-containing protein [Nocardioides marinisabuli]|uniref:PASTA domain-containing protein n=1 Tax=Nocardioides marinisabuli TaxID=419476 RepID=UPI0032193931
MSPTRLVLLVGGLAACLLAVSCSEKVASGETGDPVPEGYRWVGDGGVLVAVPDWWTTGDTECLLPVEDTVHVETGAVTDCASTVPPAPTEVSSLAVVDLGSAHGSRLLEGLSVDGDVGGEPVLSGRECGWLAPRVCRTVLAVPSRGVAFAVHVADPGDVDLTVLRGSLRLQPEGWTTVPLALGPGRTPVWGDRPATTRSYAALLRRTGLRVRVVPGPPADAAETTSGVVLPRGTLLGIEPGPGSPVEEGGTVVLTVAPSPAWQ